MRNDLFSNLMLGLAATALLGFVAVERGLAEPADAEAAAVEMFEGIEKGDIEVKLIPKDSKEANLLIENKTKRPLRVKLPEAFAGVPVAAQFGGGGVGGGGLGGGGGGGQGVGLGGGGLGGGGLGGGGMAGGGGGFFSVPAEKVGKVKLPGVCLEHGKDEPRPRMEYEVKPIDEFTTKPGVKELIAMLGHGQIDQRSAQAAAWHLNCDMSWQQIATKQLRRATGARQPYFNRLEIARGMKAANFALVQAKNRSEPSPGEQALNQ